MSKNSYIVLFVDEAEVYGPDAFEDGTIPAFGTSAILTFQNNSDKYITIGISKEAIAEKEGFVLAPADGDIPGGSFVFDLRANNVAINRVRARVHDGGSASLSVIAI